MLGGSHSAYVRRATGAAVFSKVTALIPQLIVVPLALRNLGAERFGVYGILLGVASGVMLLNVGIGPALTRLIALDTGRSKPRGDAALAGCATAIGMSMLVAFVSQVGVANVDLGKWASMSRPTEILDARNAAQLTVVILALQPIGSFGGRLAAGVGRLDAFNFVLALGNLVAGVLGLCAMLWFPSIFALMLSLSGTQAMIRVCSSLWISLPILRLGACGQDVWRTAVRLWKDSLYSFPVAGHAVVVREIGRFLLAGASNAATVGYYSFIMQVMSAMLSLITGYTSSEWPRLAAFVTEGKLNVARGTVARLYQVVAALSVLGGIAGIGEASLNLLRPIVSLSVSWITILVATLYGSALVLSHVGHIVNIAYGRLSTASRVCIVEWVAVFGVGYWSFSSAATTISTLASLEAAAGFYLLFTLPSEVRISWTANRWVSRFRVRRTAEG